MGCSFLLYEGKMIFSIVSESFFSFVINQMTKLNLFYLTTLNNIWYSRGIFLNDDLPSRKRVKFRDAWNKERVSSLLNKCRDLFTLPFTNIEFEPFHDVNMSRGKTTCYCQDYDKDLMTKFRSSYKIFFTSFWSYTQLTFLLFAPVSCLEQHN